MIFRPDMRITTARRGAPVPYERLLAGFLHVGFDRAKCRRLIGASIDAGCPATCFRNAAFEDDGMVLSNEALFPADQEFYLAFSPKNRREAAALRHELRVPDDAMLELSAFLRRGLHGHDLGAFAREYEYLGEQFVANIVSRAQPPRTTWPELIGAGLQRREHASLVIASETTRVLVDPLSPFANLPGLEGLPGEGADAWPDAILVTHSHGDHFSPIAILERARDAAVPVVVPSVPRSNLLTLAEMAREMSLFGQAVVEPSWNTSIEIGDIVIDVLPFFGEQPTRDSPGPPDGLRSWGCCYRVETPEFSVLLLVDGGEDPAGSMVDVARASRDKRGPVDVVLACLRTFQSPFFGGLACDWGALPVGRLVELFDRYESGTLPPTTAGPRGIAEICAAAGASFFMPYANGYEGLFVPISDIGWGEGEPSECDALLEVARHLASSGTPTQVVAWDPGAIARPGKRRLMVEGGWRRDAS